MSVSINNQIAFYNWQLHEMDLSWQKYHGAEVLSLYALNTLFIGRIWGYDDKRGILILRFKKGKFPRLKTPLTLSYPKAIIGNLSGWTFSYGHFRERFVENYSDCTPVFYLSNKVNDGYRYVGFRNISLEFLEHIKEDLAKKTHPFIVLGEQDPPRSYLVALRDFTESHQSNRILNLSLKDIKAWTPKSLDKPNLLVGETMDILDSSKETVIQGPPGTGKTHLIAEICNRYLNNNKRVCITALTHKALMEAAEKDGLRFHCEGERVYKTNLSSDEAKTLPGIQGHHVSEAIPKGNLLLSTYYALSELLMNNGNHVHFDLLIIEEASQAFLTTIAGFSSLADKVLVVGDFMQLQPIVLEERKAVNIDKEIYTLIHGLKSYVTNKKKNSYRLVNSFRLTAQSAAQTGIFYDDSLLSLSAEKGISLKGNYSGLFCPKGGTSLLYLDNMDEGKIPKNAIHFIGEVISEIRSEYPNKEVAVLAAYRHTVNAIVDRLLNVGIDFKRLEVETVDRIQGMTVDICIYLIPSYRPKFSFNENRFNVATSRARNGTLIIAEDLVIYPRVLPSRVMSYIDQVYKPVSHE